jgi:hypothetical protein
MARVYKPLQRASLACADNDISCVQLLQLQHPQHPDKRYLYYDCIINEQDLHFLTGSTSQAEVRSHV